MASFCTSVRAGARVTGRTAAGAARFGAAASVAGMREGVKGAGRYAASSVLPDTTAHPSTSVRMVDLPGRGRTLVTDIPGPRPDSPTVVLLHALACTGYLTWFGVLHELAQDHRVIVFDQRWHGRGIRSERFLIEDCADDVAAVLDHAGVDEAILAGYSLGGAVAQATWRRHPERVSGLVLCSTAGHFREHLGERVFFPAMTGATQAMARYALQRVERLAEGLPFANTLPQGHVLDWGLPEFRSTSAWTTPEVLGALGRFSSVEWLPEIDVPTSVVVTARDLAIPAPRQLRLGETIPGARTWTVAGGHASVVARHARWSPVFHEAMGSVVERVAALPTRRTQLAGGFAAANGLDSRFGTAG